MRKISKGFSLVETMIVVAIITIGSSAALVQMRSSLKVVDADRACDLVMENLRYARQVAVDQRRDVLVQFIGTNQIKGTRQDGGGATTVIYDLRLPTGFTFSWLTGSGEAALGYGTGTGVTFNGATSGTFHGDGVFVSTGTNTVLNGSVFTKGDTNSSARAVTLSGASGRTKTYLIKNGVWADR